MLQSTPSSSILHSNKTVTIPTGYNVADFVFETTAPYSSPDDMSAAAFIESETKNQITFKELRDQVCQVASGLVNKYRLKRGDVVAIFSPNHINFATIFLAAQSVGIIVTTINPMYTEKEVSHQLEHSDTKIIVTVAQSLTVSKNALALIKKDIPIISMDMTETEMAGFRSLFSDEAYDKLVFKEGECFDTPALIAYSSGTTGLPKGVITTQYNLIANLMQTEAALVEEDKKTTHFLGLLPFFHCYGIMMTLLQGVHRHLTIVTMRRFEPSLFLKTIEIYKFNYLSLAPPVLLFLAKHPMINEYDLSSVRKILSGAAPLPLDVAKMVEKRLNCRVAQGYGMTEASPVITISESDNAPPDVAGQLLANISAKIVDPESNKLLDPSETGELWIKGPNIMKGYLNNDKATNEMFDSDGFMRTGDVGFFDESGFLHIVDRAKELIKYKGYQIAPAELEDALLAHPDVKDCCVIGVANDDMEELPKAFIVVTDSELPVKDRIDAIQSSVQKGLAPYKYFRGGFEVVDSIPKSAAGKILRRLMRDRQNANKIST